MLIYAREGVSHVWLVDPIARTLEVFRLARGKRKTRKAAWTLVDVWRDDARVRAEPFEVFQLHLDALWR